MSHDLDEIAVRIFTAAVEQRRAGELLQCLFDGGSATIDAHGNLVVVDAGALDRLRDS